MKSRLQLSTAALKSALFLALALVYIFLYTFLHEGGHALVAALSGAAINAFNINFFDLSAHVEIAGALSPAQTILMNAAGVSLPFLAWLVFILAVPKRGSLPLELFKCISSVGGISVWLVWIIFPLVYLGGGRPGDDSISFLNNSRISPLLVSGASLLIFAGGWALFLSKIDGVRHEIELFIQPGREWMTPAAGRTLGILAGAFAACGLAAFALNGFSFNPTSHPQAIQPPAGYTLQQTLDLSSGAHAAETVLTFDLDQARLAGVFIILRDVQTGLIDLRLSSPDAYDQPLFHAEGYTARLDTAHLEDTLPAGRYQVILTSQASPGTVEIYTR
jgi:hypothetical protein